MQCSGCWCRAILTEQLREEPVMGSSFDTVFPGTPARSSHPGEVLVLTRRDVAMLLQLDACIGVVEQAFRLHGERKTAEPGVLGIPVEGAASTSRPASSR